MKDSRLRIRLRERIVAACHAQDKPAAQDLLDFLPYVAIKKGLHSNGKLKRSSRSHRIENL